MQRSSFFGLVCVVALVAVVFLSVVSGAEANCSLLGRWRSFDNSDQYQQNFTFDFKADNTYQANVSPPPHFNVQEHLLGLNCTITGHLGRHRLQVRHLGDWCVAPAVER
jgi:hypothetical protein